MKVQKPVDVSIPFSSHSLIFILFSKPEFLDIAINFRTTFLIVKSLDEIIPLQCLFQNEKD